MTEPFDRNLPLDEHFCVGCRGDGVREDEEDECSTCEGDGLSPLGRKLFGALRRRRVLSRVRLAPAPPNGNERPRRNPGEAGMNKPDSFTDRAWREFLGYQKAYEEAQKTVLSKIQKDNHSKGICDEKTCIECAAYKNRIKLKCINSNSQNHGEAGMSKNKRYRPLNSPASIGKANSANTLSRISNTDAVKIDRQKIVDLVDAQEGRGLTGKEIENQLGMRSASSRINEMVRDGWLIRTHNLRRNPTSRGPETGPRATILITPDDDTPRIVQEKPKETDSKILVRLLQEVITSVMKYNDQNIYNVKGILVYSEMISTCREAQEFLSTLSHKP